MKKLFIYFIVSLFFTTVAAKPLIWNIKSVEKAKAGNTVAVGALIREANKCLRTDLVTVMDKPMTPPSGDKHDYMSMGRYWWPNPKSADGLPYIRKDGISNPEIEKLDRNPLGKFARNVSVLSLAYYLTDDSKYAYKAVENLQIWFLNKGTKMNPNMNFGQTIPGRFDGKGRGEGVLDTYSFVEMLDGVELLKGSKIYTKKVHIALQEWFSSYLNWMLNSEIGQEENAAKNNHGTAFDIQLLRYALFVGNEKLAKEIIAEFPSKRLYLQIEPNGAQPFELARTTALGYSVFNLTHFLDICQMAQSLNIDLYNSSSNDGRSIRKAIEFLLTFMDKPQSEFPYQQIKDWDNVQNNLRWQLYRADKLNSTKTYAKYYDKLIFSTQKDNNIILY